MREVQILPDQVIFYFYWRRCFSRRREIRMFAIFEKLKSEWKNEGRTVFERNQQSDSLAAAKPITNKGNTGSTLMVVRQCLVLFACVCLYLLVELALVPALVQHQRELCVSYKCGEE